MKGCFAEKFKPLTSMRLLTGNPLGQCL